MVNSIINSGRYMEMTSGHLDSVKLALGFFVALLVKIPCIRIVNPLSLERQTLQITRSIRFCGSLAESGLGAHMTCYQKIATIFVMHSVKDLVCQNFQVTFNFVFFHISISDAIYLRSCLGVATGWVRSNLGLVETHVLQL